MAKDTAMQNLSAPIPALLPTPTTAWSLRAWPPVLWQATDPAPVRFHHLSTRIDMGSDQPGLPAGQTIWAATAAEGDAGMAWDWVQLARGVVAIADPMSVVTNVRLIGDEGEVLTAHQAAVFLNQLLRRLPWQHEVQRALSAHLN